MTDKDKQNIVEEFSEKISRLAHRMLFDSELAKEAAQECWCEILKSLDSFKGNSDIATWIYTISKRVIWKFAKTEKVIKTVEYNEHFERGPIHYSGAEEDYEQWVKDKCDYCLTAFCHCLTNDARLIFLFRDIAELSDSVISRIVGMKENNVRKVVSRSRKKVKSFMDKDCILINSSGSCRCRIQNHIRAVELEKEYQKLAKAKRLIELFNKFDKELPRKNYWEKFLSQDVTN